MSKIPYNPTLATLLLGFTLLTCIRAAETFLLFFYFNWFVVPALQQGYPSFWQMLGIMLALNYLFLNFSQDDKEAETSEQVLFARGLSFFTLWGYFFIAGFLIYLLTNA